MSRLAWMLLLLVLPLGANAGYHIETIVLPPELRGGISGVAFTPKGTLVLATRYGEIWMRDSDAEPWRKFAGGLDEPLGLVAESEDVDGNCAARGLAIAHAMTARLAATPLNDVFSRWPVAICLSPSVSKLIANHYLKAVLYFNSYFLSGYERLIDVWNPSDFR